MELKMAEELDIKKIAKFIYQRKNIFIYILLASIIIGAIYTFIIKDHYMNLKLQY